MVNVEDRRKQRLQFLHELFRLTNGDENVSVNMYRIGKTYNFDNDTTLNCVQYLEGEGLLRSQALGGRLSGLVGIKHAGVKEVEEALTNRKRSTKYFPPAEAVHIINEINVQSMNLTNSQFVQGGSENVFGKNIVVGSGTIGVSEAQPEKLSNDYMQSLKLFSETINELVKGVRIPEEEIKSINESITDLANDIKVIRQGKENEIGYVKKRVIESKTATLIEKVMNVLPKAAETAAAFTPLAPFSNLIGKGVQEIVNAIKT
jgi:hypothetical protein